MRQDSTTAEERRVSRRFSVSAPLTVILEGREIPAYTRDLSNSGMYFCLSAADGKFVEGDFDFVVELPPTITLSTFSRIRGQAKVVRKEKTSRNLTGMGVAAEIVGYSIFKGWTRSIDQSLRKPRTRSSTSQLLTTYMSLLLLPGSVGNMKNPGSIK